MSLFWILATIFGLATTAVILVPLLRAHFVKKAIDRRPGVTIGTGIVVALLVPTAALMLYMKWTTWNWSGAAPLSSESAQQQDMAHSLEEAIAGLEERLAANPDDAGAVDGRPDRSTARFGLGVGFLQTIGDGCA